MSRSSGANTSESCNRNSGRANNAKGIPRQFSMSENSAGGTIHCILDTLHISTYKYSRHIDTHCGQTYLDMLTLLQLLMLKDDAQDSKVLVPFPSGITNT